MTAARSGSSSSLARSIRAARTPSRRGSRCTTPVGLPRRHGPPDQHGPAHGRGQGRWRLGPESSSTTPPAVSDGTGLDTYLGVDKVRTSTSAHRANNYPNTYRMQAVLHDTQGHGARNLVLTDDHANAPVFWEHTAMYRLLFAFNAESRGRTHHGSCSFSTTARRPGRRSPAARPPPMPISASRSPVPGAPRVPSFVIRAWPSPDGVW